MSNVIIVGMQWGDEGKGKIVDLICPAFDLVVRYQGGHNAGHTVKFGDRHFSLHLIPSGILHQEVQCVLGNGMVVAPDAFLAELDRLQEGGVDAAGRLFVSNRATVLLPAHIDLDKAREAARGHAKIGTTSRGIGPAYESKASRNGVRMCDLAAPDLEERLEVLLERIDAELVRLEAEPTMPLEALVAQCREWGERLGPLLADTEHLLHTAIREGKSLLFEGAQGALLDLDHGTYPYVTSSSSTAGGACTGTGVPPSRIDGVLGVLKAYTTRVGGGPFTTELEDDTGEYLRRRGNEFGTTTGRPRRCGWLDTVAARYAQGLNGVDGIALTKLDVLDELAEIPVCTGYRFRGKPLASFPAERDVLERVEPVYKRLKGWQQKTVGTLEFEDLPQAARDYIDLIEQEVEAPVVVVSTGPRREETVVRGDGVVGNLLGERLAEVLAHRQKV